MHKTQAAQTEKIYSPAPAPVCHLPVLTLGFCLLFPRLFLVTDEDTVKRYYAKFEEKFFQTCEKELAKINTFYSGTRT